MFDSSQVYTVTERTKGNEYTHTIYIMYVSGINIKILIVVTIQWDYR